MAWKDGFVIEYVNTGADGKKRLSCHLCKHYGEDDSCSAKGARISELGKGFWRYCDCFELGSEYDTDEYRKRLMTIGRLPEALEDVGTPEKSELKRPPERKHQTNVDIPKGSIAKKRPDLLLDWDYERNKDLDPETLKCRSKQSVHWRCHVCGGQWTAKASKRATGSGCPYCTEQLVHAGFNDLETCYREIALDWNTAANGKKPSRVISTKPGSARWICHKCGFEWRQPLEERIKSFEANNEVVDDCPGCGVAGREIAKSFKKYGMYAHFNRDDGEVPPLSRTPASRYDIESEWLRSKNHGIPFRDARVSDDLSWWRSFCGHEYQASIEKRKQNPFCPKCLRLLDGRIQGGRWALDLSLGRNVRNLKRALDGETVELGWKCRRCGHCWDATLQEAIFFDLTCPECDRNAGRKRGGNRNLAFRIR